MSTTTALLCLCGCGEPIVGRDRWNRERKYVRGHNPTRQPRSKGLSNSRYMPQIVIQLAARACACCGIRWDGKVVNGQHVKETAAWEGAGLAVCRACLGRFMQWMAEGAIPQDRVENFVFFTWAGWETVQREWKRQVVAHGQRKAMENQRERPGGCQEKSHMALSPRAR